MTMYKYGTKSLANLSTTIPDIQRFMEEVLQVSPWDLGILSGLRTAEEQNALYKAGLSTKDGYDKLSTHQSGMAIDFGVYVKGAYLNGDTEVGLNQYRAVVGMILSTAKRFGWEGRVRSGADWDMDGDFSDNKFQDLGHIEFLY